MILWCMHDKDRIAHSSRWYTFQHCFWLRLLVPRQVRFLCRSVSLYVETHRASCATKSFCWSHEQAAWKLDWLVAVSSGIRDWPVVPLKLIIFSQCLIQTAALHELHTKQQPGPGNTVSQEVNCVHWLALLQDFDLVQQPSLCFTLASTDNLYCCWFVAYYSFIDHSKASLSKFNWAIAIAKQCHSIQGDVPVCWQSFKWCGIWWGDRDVPDVHCVSNVCWPCLKHSWRKSVMVSTYVLLGKLSLPIIPCITT